MRVDAVLARTEDHEAHAIGACVQKSFDDPESYLFLRGPRATGTVGVIDGLFGGPCRGGHPLDLVLGFDFPGVIKELIRARKSALGKASF
jgi:hypothetical protein